MKNWGLFDKTGAPVATGDDWHKWVCPKKEYVQSEHMHPITGEIEDLGMAPVPCPFNAVAVKLDRCEKCGMEFRYP